MSKRQNEKEKNSMNAATEWRNIGEKWKFMKKVNEVKIEYQTGRKAFISFCFCLKSNSIKKHSMKALKWKTNSCFGSTLELYQADDALENCVESQSF